jgi:hypothetical protein
MAHDIFETDDNLSSIIFYNRRLNSLQLYAIKWEFDTKQLDMQKLRKLDDEKISHDTDSSNRDSSARRRVTINLNDVDGAKNKSKCLIF